MASSKFTMCRLYRCRKPSIRMDGVYYVRSEIYEAHSFSFARMLRRHRKTYPPFQQPHYGTANSTFCHAPGFRNRHRAIIVHSDSYVQESMNRLKRTYTALKQRTLTYMWYYVLLWCSNRCFWQAARTRASHSGRVTLRHNSVNVYVPFFARGTVKPLERRADVTVYYCKRIMSRRIFNLFLVF